MSQNYRRQIDLITTNRPAAITQSHITWRCQKKWEKNVRVISNNSRRHNFYKLL